MKLLSRYKKVSRIGLTPPKPDPDRHGIAIATIIKDEADYLAEWIEFHKYVGVRNFYIYDNGSTDRSVDIARKHMGEAGAIVPFAGAFVDDRMKRPIDMQGLAFAHALVNFGAKHRWMLFIDPDEFLFPKEGRDLNALLDAHFKEAVNISLPWFMFGPSGHEAKPKGLTIENFTTRFESRLWPETRYPFKLLLDPSQVSMITTHQAETLKDGALTQNDAGKKCDNKSRDEAFFSSQYFQLNHYFTRSKEELKARKLKRGRVSQQGGNYLQQNVLDAIGRIENEGEHDDGATAFVGPIKAALKS